MVFRFPTTHFRKEGTAFRSHFTFFHSFTFTTKQRRQWCLVPSPCRTRRRRREREKEKTGWCGVAGNRENLREWRAAIYTEQVTVCDREVRRFGETTVWRYSQGLHAKKMTKKLSNGLLSRSSPPTTVSGKVC